MKYVGLTNDPETRRKAHGDPSDWWQRKFDSEEEARQWEKEMLAKPGYTGDSGGEGWRYGYTFTKPTAREQGRKLRQKLLERLVEQKRSGR